MPTLIPMIARVDPEPADPLPVAHSDPQRLVAKAGSPQADIWDFSGATSRADIFISHPIPIFVPHTVPREKVVYFPATTDWLDGLNKHLNKWDTR